MKKFLFSTILGISVTGAATASIVSRGFFEEAMENYATNTALDLKANQSDLTALSEKIGIDLWNTGNSDLAYDAFPFTSELFPEIYGSSKGWAGVVGANEVPITSYIISSNGVTNVPGLAGVTDKLLNGWTNDRGTTYQGIKALNDGWLDRATSTTYLGVKRLNDVIGTLPTGNLPPSPIYELVFPLNALPTTYPTSLSDLITVLFGDGETNPGIINLFAGGLSTNGTLPYPVAGIIPAMDAATSAQLAANSANNKIGDLPNGKNLAGMISETDAKIGTLPAGYDSVGAALSAIKGIAEEAKQKAEAAIPDPKAEGATGKYVLTVDIADSSAIPVYRWEKIDRALDETQSEQ